MANFSSHRPTRMANFSITGVRARPPDPSQRVCDSASPHTDESQPLGQTRAPRARVKGKYITFVEVKTVVM
jgi:hypothetical protein